MKFEFAQGISPQRKGGGRIAPKYEEIKHSWTDRCKQGTMLSLGGGSYVLISEKEGEVGTCGGERGKMPR